MNKRLTLEEIGQLAGVSRSTASRVINGHREVSTEVKERVLEVVEQTGYFPNQAARWLVSCRSEMLGMLIPSTVHSLFDDPYFGRLIQGVTKAANSAEQSLSLLLFESEQEELSSYRRVIKGGQLDGLIVTATRIDNSLTHRLLADQIPMVMVGRPDIDGVPFVDVDNRGGAQQAVQHLGEHGRERIGFIAPPSNTTTGQDRLSGYRQGLVERDLPFDLALVAEGSFTFAGGYWAMANLLRSQPDAVFCGSDQMASGALKALSDAGIKCPDDIAIISFDGLLAADQTKPSLTTIYQPILLKSQRVVQMLLDILDGDESRDHQEILPTELIRRVSCGCLGPEHDLGVALDLLSSTETFVEGHNKINNQNIAT